MWGLYVKDLNSPSTMTSFCGVFLPRFVSIGLSNFNCISQLVMPTYAVFLPMTS